MGEEDVVALNYANIVERLIALHEAQKATGGATDTSGNAPSKSVFEPEELAVYQTELARKHTKEREDLEKRLAETHANLTLLQYNAETELEERKAELRLKKLLEAQEVELTARRELADFEAELALAADPKAMEALEAAQVQKAQIEAEQKNMQELHKSKQELETRRINYIAAEERKLKRKNNGEISAEERANIIKQANEKYVLDKKNLDELTKERKKQEEKDQKEKKKAEKEAHRGTIENAVTAPLSREDNLVDRFKTLYKETEVEKENGTTTHSFVKALDVATTALSSMIQKLEKQIDDIAKSKSAVDTRLQGTSDKAVKTYDGSYWDQLVKDMTSISAVNPFFKQEDFSANIKKLVERGIAFDLEQRAFLMTIQDKIATTFDAADGTLLRLIRIQQSDTTAGRLGMEAALNAFLNEMYANTEYLQGVAKDVRSSLGEMQALMDSATEATEVEYEVQKWLGSLYSVGMSQSAVNSISQALGQIAAGQIEGLTGGGAGNLLVMAANEAGLAIADILAGGLDSTETNKLMRSIINYLAELAESSKDNNVVQQQLASVFGVKASDLKAATNLKTDNSIEATYSNTLSYDNMLNALYGMAGTMGERTSIAEKMTNIWNNVQYTLAGSVASSPAAYGILKGASLLDSAVGGIPIPDIHLFGNAVALNTTIADLMRVGALGTGILGSIGSLASGLGNSFSGRAMLEQVGISSGTGLTITPRGDGLSDRLMIGGGYKSTSDSGYIGYAGNSSGSDVYNATLKEAEDSKNQLMVEAQEQSAANQVDNISATVLKIYELLDEVAHGNGCLRVRVDSYGLTSTGGGAQGGVGALENLGNNSLGGNSSLLNASSGANEHGLSSGGVNSGGVGSSINFGGWTMTV